MEHTKSLWLGMVGMKFTWTGYEVSFQKEEATKLFMKLSGWYIVSCVTKTLTFSRRKNERENYDMEMRPSISLKTLIYETWFLWPNRKYMESYYSQHKHVIRRLVLIILSRRWDFTCQGSTAPCRIRITNEKIWFLYWANLNMNCKAEISNSVRK